MILTDDELSALWDEVVWSMRTSAEPWHIRRRMGRAVERAVIDKLIAECDRMHTGVTTYKMRLMGEMAGDWLRSKRGGGDE